MNLKSKITAVATAFFTLFIPASFAAEPVPLDALVAETVARNPELKFYEAEIAAAKGGRVTAGEWANPELSGELGNKRVRDLGGNKIGDGPVWSVSLAQTFEFPGRVSLRKAIAGRQIDHRVPYEVAGDGEEVGLKPEDFMLLCGSANRAKSWSCEHCENWKNLKKREVCLTCYWASPEDYEHIAMRQVRRLDLIWQGDEVAHYEALKKQARDLSVEVPAYVKAFIEGVVAKRQAVNPQRAKTSPSP